MLTFRKQWIFWSYIVQALLALSMLDLELVYMAVLFRVLLRPAAGVLSRSSTSVIIGSVLRTFLERRHTTCTFTIVCLAAWRPVWSFRYRPSFDLTACPTRSRFTSGNLSSRSPEHDGVGTMLLRQRLPSAWALTPRELCTQWNGCMKQWSCTWTLVALGFYQQLFASRSVMYRHWRSRGCTVCATNVQWDRWCSVNAVIISSMLAVLQRSSYH